MHQATIFVQVLNLITSSSILLVLRGIVACAPCLAAVAGAGAAGCTAPAAGGTRCVSRLGGAAGEEEGLWLHTPGAKDPTAPEHLEEEPKNIISLS